MLRVDLNCDLGEGMPNDEPLMAYISSANIACGAHAGSIDTIRRTIGLAIENGLAVGAHPSYNDTANFGRVDLLDQGLSMDQLKKDIESQLEIFTKVCAEFSIRPSHIKPHGALYNRAARDEEVARLIASIVQEMDFAPLLYGLSGSIHAEIARDYGLRYIQEVFADRTYQKDGTLTPRTVKGALIENLDKSLEQVISMVGFGRVTAMDGTELAIKADSICIHGDGKNALDFARFIRSSLDRE